MHLQQKKDYNDVSLVSIFYCELQVRIDKETRLRTNFIYYWQLIEMMMMMMERHDDGAKL